MTATVAICVCTYRRPAMLARCLASLAAQVEPEEFALQIIVIDNEAEPNNREAVLAFGEACPYPVTYVHQPKRGIAAARNAALDAAAVVCAEWIAFIDDDEKAAPNWIAMLMHPDYIGVPVLRGTQRFVYPIPRPFWVVPKEEKEGEGRGCKTAVTNNVRFTMEIARAGFRFDETLGLMGGEDNEFFTRVHAAGWGIKRTMRAVTYERAHPERLTYKGQVYRAYWTAASDLRGVAISRGWAGAALRKAHTVPLHLLVGLATLMASPLMLTFGQETFKRTALNGGRQVAKGLGRAAAMIGMLPEPYRVVCGH